MLLSDIIDQSTVISWSSITSKKKLFQEISSYLGKINRLNSDLIFSALQEREHLGPTAMGKGVAIPHARIEEVKNIRGLFVRLDKPVRFDALDKQAVDLIFTLIAPINDGVEHLRALAKVSRILRNSDVCKKLRSTEDNTALYSILTQDIDIKAA
tara:strand:+ start:75 stop:539 length:465 start_codon:yes stop_codon:yes gene_type:complete